MRYAFIAAAAPQSFAPDDLLRVVNAYLPDNYLAQRVPGGIGISGTDIAGWTLDGYVIPRLASGLRFAVEVTSLPGTECPEHGNAHGLSWCDIDGCDAPTVSA